MTRFLACCLALFAVLLVAAGVDARASRRWADAAEVKVGIAQAATATALIERDKAVARVAELQASVDSARALHRRASDRVRVVSPTTVAVRVTPSEPEIVYTVPPQVVEKMQADSALIFTLTEQNRRYALLAAADSAALAASRHENDALRVQVEALKPSRFEKVKGPLLFVGGLVLGAYVRGR